MKAIVVEHAGGPEVLQIRTLPRPEPRPGWVLIHVAGALQRIVDGVAAGRYRVNLDRVFHFSEIVEAHRYMEENRAQWKLVVVVD